MATGLGLLGVNLSGAEFSPPNGSYYAYPTQAEIDYEASKGMSVIRVPVEWERLQPSLGGPLSASQLSLLDGVVNRATQDGLKVVIDLHNYGKYDGQLVGSSSVSDAQFADFWGKMAEHYATNPNVIYGLMNEPAQTDAHGWLASMNAAIDAIRYHQVGGAKTALSDQEILASGINYDHADTWVGSDNAGVIGKGIVDPLGNYAFDVHQYLDSDGSGTHFGPVADPDGTDKLTAITNWANTTGQKLFLGEIGVSSDNTSLQALDNVLGYVAAHGDVWQGLAYWAAGSLWKSVGPDGQTTDYPYSAEPTPDPSNTANGGYDDKLQQMVLDRYAHQTAVAGVAITGPSGGSDVRAVTVTGRGVDGRPVDVTLTPSNGSAATTGSVPVSGGTWTYTPPGPLPDGAYTVTASQQSSDGGPAQVATSGFTLDATAPTAPSSTLTVPQGSGPTPLGLAAPSDNLTAAGDLRVSVGGLPTNGTVTLADGTTPVTAGESLTLAQLQGLDFAATPGVFDRTSTFTYAVTDGAGNSASGAATIAVGPAVAPSIAGTHATSTAAEATVEPFSGVTVTDGNVGAVDSLAITLTSGAGSLSGPGLTSLGGGSYGLAATDPATLTGELRALEFAPINGTPGATAVTTFRLTAATSAGPTTTDDGTSVADTAAQASDAPTAPAPTVPTPSDPTPPAATSTGQAPGTPTPAGQTPDGAASAVPTPAAGAASPPPAAPDAVSISRHVRFENGVFTLSGTASSGAGVAGVEITATLGNGTVKDLGAAAVDSQGNFTFADHIGRRTQAFITATETGQTGGTASAVASFSLKGGSGQNGGGAEQDSYTDDGTSQASTSRFQPDGVHTTDVLAPDQTLATDFVRLFDNDHWGDNTFVYDPGHGFNAIDGFRVGGARHDTLSFSGADFGDSIAAVLRHSYDAKDGTGVVIVDPASRDVVKLLGLTKGQLARNQDDIAFHA